MPADLRTAYLAHLREEGDASDAAPRFSPAGLEYLYHLIYRASYQGKGFRNLAAAELCGLFRGHAQSDFGAFAGETLKRFGMDTCGDLGRAVFLLAREGCLTMDGTESLETYAALGRFRFPGDKDRNRNA